jgi:hypothetical protein
MLRIQVSISGHDLVALVDCGCEATIIRNPYADNLGTKRKLLWWGIKQNAGMAP